MGGVVATVRHVLLVNDPAAAERLAADLRATGYDVAIDTHDGGWTWIVRGTETAATPAGIAAGLAEIAARHGAEYEGAEAAPG